MTEQEAITILDRVLERAARGVPLGREINADEMAGVLRGAATWKAAAFAAAEALQDAHQRAIE